MYEQMRPLRCDQGRATAKPCEEPPVYEFIEPAPSFYCEAHALERLSEGMEERWVQLGEREYLAQLEEAVNTLYDARDKNCTLRELHDTWRYYLDRELERARQAYVEVGGKPEPIRAEVEETRGWLEFLLWCEDEDEG